MATIFGWFFATQLVGDPAASQEDSSSAALSGLSGLTVSGSSFVQSASVATQGNPYITDGDTDEVPTPQNQNVATAVDVGGSTRFVDEIASFGSAGGGPPNTLTYNGISYDAASLGEPDLKVVLFTDGTYMILLDEAVLEGLRTALGVADLDPSQIGLTLGGNEDAATADRTWGLETTSHDGAGLFTAEPSDQVVQGTAGGERIDTTFADDPQGDRIDTADGPGGSDGDVVSAGGGDDTVVAGAGDDSVEGGQGNDLLIGDDVDAGGEVGAEVSPLYLSAAQERAGSLTATDRLDAQPGDSVIFDNVGFLADGTPIAARLVLVSTTDPAMDIAFNRAETAEIVLNNLSDPAFQGAQATFRLEFLDAGTGLPITITGQATFGDIDLNGATNATNFEQVILGSDQLVGYEVAQDSNLAVSSSGGIVTATGTIPNSPPDQPAWFTANFDSIQSLTFTLTARSENSGYTLNGQVINDPATTVFDTGASDTLRGGDGDDALYGQEGNDQLHGDLGNDVVSGGHGDDQLFGGWADTGKDTLYGGAGSDLLHDGDGDDQHYGGEGDDISYLGAGADQAYGGGGADELIGHVGQDQLYGGVGSDTLTGGADGDELSGGDDQDTIYGAAGDTVFGGNGGVDQDTLYVRDVQSIVYDANPENGTVVFNDGGSLTFTDIENLQVLNSDGIVSGTAAADAIGVIYSDADGDYIDNDDAVGTFGTFNEDDYVLAGAGNDTVWASDGNDQISGGTDNDELYGGSGDDRVDGDAGNDRLDGDSGADTLVGGEGEDSLFGGDDNDEIHDNTGDNLAYGGAGNDSIFMGAGNDSLYGDAGDDLIIGGDGNDSLVAGTGSDSLEGGTGDDTLVGGGTGYLDGGDDADMILGFGGDQVVGGEGGTDVDTLIIGADGVITYGGGDNESGTVAFADGTTLTFSQIEAVVYDGVVDGTSGADSMAPGYADAQNDQIDGTDGDNDTIFGYGGHDTIEAGAGDDTAFGGAGDDRISGGDGQDSLTGEAGSDVLTGDAGNDLLIGDFAADSIGGATAGPGAADTLSGGSGTDSIYGGAGDDHLDGGLDDDTLRGGHGDDTLLGGGGNDDIEGLYGDDLVYGGDGDDHVFGRDGADLIYGGDGADTLIGGIGVDTIYGGAGNDLLAGSQGNDSIYGGDGNDLVFIGAPAFGDITYTDQGTVFLDAGDDFLDAGDATLEFISYGGAGNDLMNSGVGDDTMDGGSGNDTLNTGGGDDVVMLFDGFGQDSLVGGETGETIGDTLDATGLTTGVVLDLSAGDPANPENGTLTDGINVATFFQIEQVSLGAGDDYVLGSAGDDVVFTGAGKDTVDGGAGADRFDLGSDGDSDVVVLADGYGPQTITGFDAPIDNGDGTYSGTDTLDLSGLTDADGNAVNTADVVVSDTNGDGTGDAILTFPNGESITLTGIDPALAADPAYLLALGVPLAPDFIVSGTAFDDVIDAAYVGDPEGDRIDAGDNASGTDADLVIAGDGADLVDAGGGDDLVYGGTGADTLQGGDGDDSLSGDAGDDDLSGAAGDDSFVVTDGFGVDIVLGGENAEAAGDTLDASGLTVDTALDLEALGAGDPESGFLTTSDGDSVQFSEIEHIVLGSGNDDVLGSSGDDIVATGAGSDTVAGAGGNDLFDLGSDGDGDIVVLADGEGNDTLTGFDAPVDNGDGTYTGVDTLDLTSLTDGFGNPVTTADVVVTDTNGDGSGDAVLTFPNGESLTLTGIDPGLAADPAYLEALGIPSNGAVDGAETSEVMAPGYADSEGDLIDGADGLNDTIFGNGGDDTITAGDGTDTVFGGDGADQISGDDGDDDLFGGLGDDTLSGGLGTDTLTGDEGNDSLTGGDGTDQVFGGAGADTLVGGADADTLSGGDDRDLIFGGIGDVIDGGEGGDDSDRLNLSAIGGAGFFNVSYGGGDDESGSIDVLDGGGAVIGSIAFSNIESIVPCFTPGSRILTEKGEIAVEAIVAGVRVLTRDNGWQVVRWTGQRALSAAALAASPRFNPVCIRAGALGAGVPERDLTVSPQHRLLLAGPRAEMLFGEHEVLVAAIHLVNDRDILRIAPQGVTYIHLLFDRHEIIRADGAWTESFQPGDRTLHSMDAAQREEVLALFPDLHGRDRSYPAARLALKAHEARVLLAI